MSSTDHDRIYRENNWVNGINRGDEQAFGEMYKYYYPRLGQFLLRYVKNPKKAEDIIHNVFYEIWKNRTRLEPRGTLRAYLYTASRNQALKYLNREDDRPFSDIDDHHDLAHTPDYTDQTIDYKEFDKAVIDAVNELPEQRRKIFLMHREDQLKYREIADILNISIKTVETQMSRALKFLNKKLAPFKKD